MAILYDYFCEKCNHAFEDMKTMDEREFSICPKCGAKSNKMMSVGHGWCDDVDSIKYRISRDVKEIQKKKDNNDANTIESLYGTKYTSSL